MIVVHWRGEVFALVIVLCILSHSPIILQVYSYLPFYLMRKQVNSVKKINPTFGLQKKRDKLTHLLPQTFRPAFEKTDS